jgi:DNA polymerase-3 subunit delta
MSITTLAGRNSYLIESELNVRLKAFTASNGEIGIERIDAEKTNPKDILPLLNSPSLFASKKITIIRGLSSNKEFSEQFINLLEQSFPQEMEILLIEPNIDARGRLYKALKQRTEFKLLDELKPYEIAKWVEKTVVSRGGEISSNVAEYLVEKTGSNQQQIENEINKLILYSPEITKDNINLLVESSIGSTTFDLAEAAFSHDKSKAIKLYMEQRALRIAPAVIIGSLAWQLNLLALVKSASSKSDEQLAIDNGMKPWAVSKAKRLARGISSNDLIAAIDNLLDIDAKSKSAPINIDDALLYYLLKIS